MLHTFGFAGAKTDSTANEAIPAPADASLTQQNNNTAYLMPYDAMIAWAFALNDTITRARLNYPSYRDLGLPEIFPLLAVADITADPDLCVWRENGPRVRKNEAVGVDCSNGASTVDTAGAVISIIDGIQPVPNGRRFSVRGTSAQTLIANAWTLGGITLDQQLPFGRYGVIGIQCTVPDAIAARLVFTNQTYHRPGCVIGETIGIGDPLQTMRAGKYGLLGTFEQTSPPNLEILGFTAGAETAAVILDLVELR